MLNQTHPDDDRLSALAFEEADATADASLTSHVATCDRCAELVRELGSLRASLAELPDITPPRPLRLLPPVEPEPVGAGAAAWVRRLFAPVLTAGAAIAMVGLVGTTAPALGGAQSGAAPADGGIFEEVGNQLGGAVPEASAPDNAPAYAEESVAIAGGADNAAGDSTDAPRQMAEGVDDRAGDEAGDRLAQVPAERSPWPMVLFTGITIMVGVALLRWILLPRAG